MPHAPRPHPTAVKLLRGEKRPSRVNYLEPKAPLGVGAAPAHLAPASRAVWEELAPLLESARIVTSLDPVAFELLTDSIADYRQLRLDPKHGAFAGGAWKRVVKLLEQVGLTPSSRTRLVAAPELSPKDFAFEAFVARKPTR